MAKKLRFQYENIETSSEGILDTRGRKGLADVPVHNKSVYLTIKIRTDEPDQRLRRLSDLVTHYCPVDSFVRAAVPDYHITWERIAEGAYKERRCEYKGYIPSNITHIVNRLTVDSIKSRF